MLHAFVVRPFFDHYTFSHDKSFRSARSMWLLYLVFATLQTLLQTLTCALIYCTQLVKTDCFFVSCDTCAHASNLPRVKPSAGSAR